MQQDDARDDGAQDETGAAIVRAAIHPAIGIARVGDSIDEYLVGPEVPDPPPLPPGSYKDAAGALKRQAARFRVYGYDAAGQVVRELTAGDVDIEWTVHVANLKGQWYEFQLALDIPEADFPDVPPSRLRNAAEPDRAALGIDAGPHSVSGVLAGPVALDGGTFLGTPVGLGEMRTDDAGRLLFLGGRGVSGSPAGLPLTTFANNEGWYDDTSDGPVTATVSIGGREIPCDPAWVVTAPPNYAPDLKSVRTMHDLLVDVYTEAGWFAVQPEVSFANDVLPILRRLVGLQWVNQGFATAYGWQGPSDFLTPEYLARLADNGPTWAELRNQVWMTCRDWARDKESPVPWPWIYGDTTNFPPVSPRQHITLSPTQYSLLARWAKGDFVSDYDASYVPPPALEDVPVPEQPATLDRAALDFCLADAFHPGCEMTWPVRHATMYAAPFRIRHRPPGWVEPSYGTRLVPPVATAVDGPLYAQAPGGLSRWMAVPWQADTASCRSGYQDVLGFGPLYDPYVPTFWPARVPNQVLTEEDYAIVVDTSLPMADRVAAFERRAVWIRALSPNQQQAITEMVTDFGKLGVVEARPGAEGFPDVILVESQVGLSLEGVEPTRNLITFHTTDPVPPPRATVAGLLGRPVHEVNVGYIDKLNRFTNRR